MSEQTIIARHICDGIVSAYVITDATRNHVALDIALDIRDGMRIENVDSEDVRTGRWCECFKEGSEG